MRVSITDIFVYFIPFVVQRSVADQSVLDAELTTCRWNQQRRKLVSMLLMQFVNALHKRKRPARGYLLRRGETLEYYFHL